ncbi:hypothetical protein HOG98_01725 [bacterium]|nr:hypothetical protein [bacterium]
MNLLNIQNIRSIGDNDIVKLGYQLRLMAKKDQNVKAFVSKIDQFIGDDDVSVLCIKNQPFSPSDERYLDCFTRVILNCLKLEDVDDQYLTGQDSAVEAFHSDRGTPDGRRIKDVFAIACSENKPNIPFVVLPWKTIRLNLSFEIIEGLKARNQVFPDPETMATRIPILSVDDRGRELFFFDNRLSTGLEERDIYLETLHSTINKLEDTHSIELYIQPGETAIVKNFGCLHKRGSKKQSKVHLDYLARKVIRYDTLNPASSGLEVIYR